MWNLLVHCWCGKWKYAYHIDVEHTGRRREGNMQTVMLPLCTYKVCEQTRVSWMEVGWGNWSTSVTAWIDCVVFTNNCKFVIGMDEGWIGPLRFPHQNLNGLVWNSCTSWHKYLCSHLWMEEKDISGTQEFLIYMQVRVGQNTLDRGESENMDAVNKLVLK